MKSISYVSFSILKSTWICLGINKKWNLLFIPKPLIEPPILAQNNRRPLVCDNTDNIQVQYIITSVRYPDIKFWNNYQNMKISFALLSLVAAKKGKEEWSPVSGF